MGLLWSKKSDFKCEFHKMVHHMVSEKEFEDGWDAMLERYSLKKHPFLREIYEVWHKCAKPYFRGVFCAKMTSTQRSERANHMLKSYVPRGCPMHLFIKQYEKLQFDMESEESFEEKRTSLVNLPIERHASKIYTRAMFEQFGESLYKAGAYEIDVVEPMKLYHLTHVDALAREKWSKVQFKVEVMIELKLATIPDKYIMKRWTKDARDILPEHLARYERDKGPRGYETYRHNAMYIKALECVRLGDNNVKFYYVFMAMMKEVYTTLLPLSQGKAVMGLEEWEAAQGRPAANGTYASIVDGTNFMEQCETMSNCSGIAPASSKRPAGRPTTSREKASYEHKQKRSRFCKICRGEGHKSTTCPDRGDLPKPPRKMPRCSKCGVLGHLKNLCGKTTDPFEPNFL
ncbi:hypothetical protein D1007_01689 [Hordeum vulgare]|nr:hypothetical protein D1007_01689 [Hordeum vulgare]